MPDKKPVNTTAPKAAEVKIPTAKAAEVKTPTAKAAEVKIPTAKAAEGTNTETKTAPTNTTKTVKTSNAVFIELLPDERISRHAALKMVRGFGLGCSQARMSEILLEKYGPAPIRVAGSTTGTGTSAEAKAAKEKIRLENEAKALAVVRAKREAAKKGEEVEGYKAETVKFEGGLEAAKKAEVEAINKANAANAANATDEPTDSKPTDSKPAK